MGNIQMQTATISNRIFTDITSLGPERPSEFYQQLTLSFFKGILTKQALQKIGQKLIALAEHAYSLRQVSVVREVSQLLLTLPLSRSYKSLGHYYHALCLYRSGNLVKSRRLLEGVLEHVPKSFRGRVLISISATYY